MSNAQFDATPLYHYTCEHGRNAIGSVGELLPAARLTTKQVPPSGHFVWLTDMAEPDRDALGLTSATLDCDRLAHRYRVVGNERCNRWLHVRGWLPELHYLELAPGALPAHWWLTTRAVRVEYAPHATDVSA